MSDLEYPCFDFLRTLLLMGYIIMGQVDSRRNSNSDIQVSSVLTLQLNHSLQFTRSGTVPTFCVFSMSRHRRSQSLAAVDRSHG